MGLGLAIVNTATQVYDFHAAKIDAHVAEVDALNKKIGDVIDFLERVNGKRNGKDDIVFATEEERDLVDRLRQIAPGAVPSHTYSWKADQIDGLVEVLNSRIKHLSNQITPITAKMSDASNDQREIMKICSELLKRLDELIKLFLSRSKV